MTTATTDTPAPAAENVDTLEVVLGFTSLDDYRAMGDDLATVRTKLNLPGWSTPTEVIAAALRAQAGSV